MKARPILIGTALLAAAVAAILLVPGYIEQSKREAYIHRCNEEGATGAAFTSRQYCENLYNRGVKLDGPAGNGT